MRHRLAAMVAALAIIVFGAASVTAAAAPSGSVGHDVSYPQCSGTSTTASSVGGDFGVVGVSNGLPWSTNPCLLAEYSWAARLPDEASLYLNTANPAPRSSFYWPTSGASDPALCVDSTSTSDAGCAYDYGWHAAANGLSTATATIGSAVATLPWWLDVETANSWNGSATANSADLQGAVDYLRSHGVPSVGLYSTSYAWTTITGGYTTSTAASYVSAWSGEFAPAYPMTQAPTWVAGVGTATSASTTCNNAGFTGPTPRLAQFKDGSGLDADLVCGAPPAQTVGVTVNPTSGTARAGATKSTAVTVTESGNSQAVSLTASSVPQGPSLSLTPASLAGPGTATLTIGTRGVPAGTYTVTVTAAGASSGHATATYTLTVRRK